MAAITGGNRRGERAWRDKQLSQSRRNNGQRIENNNGTVRSQKLLMVKQLRAATVLHPPRHFAFGNNSMVDLLCVDDLP